MTKDLNFLIIGGPSCSGKTPLVRSLRKEFPDLAGDLKTPVLYHSRAPRAKERDGEDYHFRSRKEVEGLIDKSRYGVFETHGHLQAVDFEELSDLLNEGRVVYEGAVEVALALRDMEFSAPARVVDIFISPLSMAEVQVHSIEGNFQSRLNELMRQRLLRRAYNQRSQLSLGDLQNIEIRVESVYSELSRATEFNYVIANHDGEDSDHWEIFSKPIGDAAKTVRAVASIMAGDPNERVERWPANLLPR